MHPITTYGLQLAAKNSSLERLKEAYIRTRTLTLTLDTEARYETWIILFHVKIGNDSNRCFCTFSLSILSHTHRTLKQLNYLARTTFNVRNTCSLKNPFTLPFSSAYPSWIVLSVIFVRPALRKDSLESWQAFPACKKAHNGPTECLFGSALAGKSRGQFRLFGFSETRDAAYDSATVFPRPVGTSGKSRNLATFLFISSSSVPQLDPTATFTMRDLVVWK